MAIITTNDILIHKSVTSLDSDINQVQSKHNLVLRKIDTLETATEPMG